MKKVLILTYYWPPAGGPGVQRVVKFAKYLPEFGWEPVILTVKNGEYPHIDRTLAKDIPENCTIYKTKSIEPFKLYKFILGKPAREKIPTYVLDNSKELSTTEKIAQWVRSNIFIPDAKIGWYPFAVKNGLKIIEKENIDLIFSSSPPHSVQVIAKSIAKRTGLKWIADYRDPWIEAFYQIDVPQMSIIKNFHTSIEQKTLAAADAVISVSSPIIDLFKTKAENKYHIIPNGFDKADFEFDKKTSCEFYRITYIGTLGKSQKLNNFLSALSSLEPGYRSQIKMHFYGHLHPAHLKKITEYGLQESIKISPHVPHNEIISKIINSELLLLVIPDVPHNRGIVTGKLFEYLATGNFILAIGPKNGTASKILENTSCGKMFDYDEDLRQVLIDRIDDWRTDKEPDVLPEEVDKYSRKRLAALLSKIFDENIAQSGSIN